MNCPNCHCPRGEPLTVATNSLVTRCQHAFHAVSPARPDDFATETAKGTTPPPPSHHGAAKTIADASVYSHPYTTPIPTAHDGSTGWVWCATCESPQPVSGHPCGIEKSVQWMHEEMPRLRADLEAAEADLDRAEVVKDLALSHLVGAEARAEFAESLLCATVFGHGLAYGTCRCDFCNIIRDAARGGGR